MTRRELLRLMGAGAVAGATGRLSLAQAPFVPDVELALRASPGVGMQMAHPIHLHGRQFRVVGREGTARAGATLREGIVSEGWLDTVLVMPGEMVRIKIPFTRHPGLYLYHCHILEHEDMGMMRNFRVTSSRARGTVGIIPS